MGGDVNGNNTGYKHIIFLREWITHKSQFTTKSFTNKIKRKPENKVKENKLLSIIFNFLNQTRN